MSRRAADPCRICLRRWGERPLLSTEGKNVHSIRSDVHWVRPDGLASVCQNDRPVGVRDLRDPSEVVPYSEGKVHGADADHLGPVIHQPLKTLYRDTNPSPSVMLEGAYLTSTRPRFLKKGYTTEGN